MPWKQAAYAQRPGNCCYPDGTSYPASNTAAIVTLRKSPGVLRWIAGIQCGYNGTPTNGLLTIVTNGITAYSMPVTTSGPAPIPFEYSFEQNEPADLVITLAAGGSGVTGYLSVIHGTILAALQQPLSLDFSGAGSQANILAGNGSYTNLEWLPLLI